MSKNKVTNIADARLKKDNLLAVALNDAGILAPLMESMFQQLEDEALPSRSFARQILAEENPDMSDEEIDAIAELY